MIITDERTRALANICRFNGHVKRHYSVLEHTVIGVFTMDHMREPKSLQRAFLLHDYEESVFGDIVRPVKEKYMLASYRWRVRDFNRMMCDSLTPPMDHTTLSGEAVSTYDNHMLAAELASVATVTDPKYPFDKNSAAQQFARKMIRTRKFQGNVAIAAFERFRKDLQV